MSTTERLWSVSNGKDTAELVQNADGSVDAIGTVVNADGTEVRHVIRVQQPAKRQLTLEEQRRNAIAAEIAAGPMGPRAAERYLRGEFEVGAQLPVLAARPPSAPPPGGYDADAEDRARMEALKQAWNKPPVLPAPTKSVEDEVREARMHLALDAAVEKWKAMTV